MRVKERTYILLLWEFRLTISWESHVHMQFLQEKYRLYLSIILTLCDTMLLYNNTDIIIIL